jgi:hypothetical protein
MNYSANAAAQQIYSPPPMGSLIQNRTMSWDSEGCFNTTTLGGSKCQTRVPHLVDNRIRQPVFEPTNRNSKGKTGTLSDTTVLSQSNTATGSSQENSQQCPTEDKEGDLSFDEDFLRFEYLPSWIEDSAMVL